MAHAARDNRERKIIAAAPCVFCGAAIGAPCVRYAGSTETTPPHPERRDAWQAQRGPVAPAQPIVRCACGHAAKHHGSERNDEYGCEDCDCARSREEVRRAST